MAQALELARARRYRTSPNPTVGAVLVRDGEVVGEGSHEGPGLPHAEVVALERAGARALGATLYVSLEPCCHVGRTGPCVERIVAAKVAQVHCATLDPNPLVDGRGVAQLRGAGIPVVVGALEAEAKELIREFSVWVRERRPWVTLKVAMSLDGKVATAGGESQWITSAPARARAHQLRSQHDAVMVGSGTVLADDPRLSVRGERSPRQPLRVIADGRLRTPARARALTAPGGPTVIATRAGADALRAAELREAGAEVLELAAGADGVELAPLLALLADRKVTSLLVEGGPTLLGSFWAARLGDRVAVFVAPLLLGGSHAPGPFGGEGAERLAAGWQMAGLSAEAVGGDLLLTAEA